MVFSGTPDIFGLLMAQTAVSLHAIETLDAWSSSGDDELARRVGDLEHRADEARSNLVQALREALTTPIDQEHLYVLSERCDRVVNAAKNLVHQAQAFDWPPDRHAAQMATEIHRSMERLCHGFDCLGHDRDAAASAADEALKASRAVARSHRHALAELVAGSGDGGLLATQEMYRWYAQVGELIAATADRLWFAVLSLA